MGITSITGEEFDTYDKVESPMPYDFRVHNGKYYTFEEFGIASVRRIFEIQADDLKEYLNGQRSADDILFKAQNDAWPPTEEEKKIAERESVVKSPTVLIDIPKYRKLFTYEELERLIPIAEQQWIDWKGKLPDDYVSPLK